ncbi:P47 [Epinotia aporema granulovirus]|uniref:p47 n=1 Tax=Epinotia aporema granulovirus TaxID=166056 RepID=K4ER62_9BBAC|nr:P47 [Epinotia aporema granulovirus]AER41489.1 P47 [Epinotia aporema granulovirus]
MRYQYDKNMSSGEPFYKELVLKSQYFPQCVKYLSEELFAYWLMCRCDDGWIVRNKEMVVKEGFVAFKCTFMKFNFDSTHDCCPADLELYATHGSGLSQHDAKLLMLVLRDRWYKGDFERLKKILCMSSYDRLLNFVENCIWERSYEDNYTLGQQLSIRMTTNLIQSGLDFKHHISEEVVKNGRGWDDVDFEKMLCTIKSVADITKRYRWSHCYVILELDRQNICSVLGVLRKKFVVKLNSLIDNVCMIKEKNSRKVLGIIKPLIVDRMVNVVFVTDTENYIHTNKIFYIYNSMKFYYYCLKNRYVFFYNDYETLYLVYTIVMIEVINGGCLNSFQLEKSTMMHPLELNSRRCNALKRAAVYNKTLCNDMELKVDFIHGKRITTGTHNPSRIIDIK